MEKEQVSQTNAVKKNIDVKKYKLPPGLRKSNAFLRGEIDYIVKIVKDKTHSLKDRKTFQECGKIRIQEYKKFVDRYLKKILDCNLFLSDSEWEELDYWDCLIPPPLDARIFTHKEGTIININDYSEEVLDAAGGLLSLMP